ncbi:MAG: hypothetical protein HP491_06515 [Nitrospira sp.]|nr:hypothetical protein [Nitrospira sp.]
MKHLLGHLVLGVLLICSVPVEAHKAKRDEVVKPLHGGQALAAGPYHLELVAKSGELVLYVTDHADKAVPTEGAKAKATIQQGFEKARIEVVLEPSGDNQLTGTGAFTVNQDTGIMVFLKLPNQEAHAARFTPLSQKLLPNNGNP